MQNINTLHFDTVSAGYSSDDYDPYDINFDMQSNPQYNVGKIYLKSIEFPIGFNNVRGSGTLNKIAIQLIHTGGVDVLNLTIPNNNYETIESLLTAINATLPYMTHTQINFSVEIDKVKLSVTSTKYTSIELSTKTQLTRYILGFDKTATYSNNNMTVTAENIYNLNIDNYVIMYISNIITENTSATRQNCSFKIPISALKGDVVFYFDNSGFNQAINVLVNEPIFNLKVQIFDRFNNKITRSSDYSFTLAFEKRN